jgi:hypothetical protein
MQSDRTAGASEESSGWSASGAFPAGVQGLGVTDGLRVELEPHQLPSLVDEIGVLRDVVEDALVHERQQWESIPESVRRERLPRAVEAEEELDRLRYEARVLEMIRGQVVEQLGGKSTAVVVGPSRIVAELVRGTTRRVVEDLGELLQVEPRDDAAARAELVRTAVAARSWVETYVGCQAVEWLSFEPDADPQDA